jgi:uncharacterized membrane protein YhiD involved in acid resistance
MLESVSWQELILRLAIAAAAGMAIGLEREWREKSAGFRTITLVSTGSADLRACCRGFQRPPRP